MFQCVRCSGVELNRSKRGDNVLWECQRCHGKLMGIGVLRKLIPKPLFNQIWHSATDLPRPGVLHCPGCNQRMLSFSISMEGQTVNLDACRTCYMVWFDDQEFESLPSLPPPKEFSPQAKEAIALLEVDLMRERAEQEKDTIDDIDPVADRSWVTLGVIGVASLASIYAIISKQEWIREFALVPAQSLRYGGVTFVTSFFLHANFNHLLGNMFFLLILGGRVENYMGHLRYTLLLAVAAIAGGLVEVAFWPQSEIPLIGASGGISAVLVFYVLSFPYAWIPMPIINVWMLVNKTFRVPILAWFFFWIILQVLGAYMEWHGFHEGGGTAYLAHLSGVAVGFLFWLAWRKKEFGSLAEL